MHHSSKYLNIKYNLNYSNIKHLIVVIIPTLDVVVICIAGSVINATGLSPLLPMELVTTTDNV